MKICALGYIGIGVPDPRACLDYATSVLGLMPARACPGEDWGMPAVPGSGPASAGSGIAADGSGYLKMDDWQWRIGVHPRAGGAGLVYLGLEWSGGLERGQARGGLRAAGCEARAATET